MNILNEIIAAKIKELEQVKINHPEAEFRKSFYFNREPISLAESLKDTSEPGIIAEFKRKSPSKGIINDKVSVEEVVKGYEKAGVAAVSVLTNQAYFMGEPIDVVEARNVINIPVLRKEFMIDEYQISEAKAIGADVILLIAATLDTKTTKRLAQFAKELGLEVLLEVHNEKELEHINKYIDMIGVNNRNLTTFEVDINTSLILSKKIPDEFVKISESGISNTNDVKELYNAGYKGFLIGENFMKTENPGNACLEFIKGISKN